MNNDAPTPGLFTRWAKDSYLSEIPLYRNLMMMFNILEYSKGIVRPPGGGNGFGWSFGGSSSSSNDPATATIPVAWDIVKTETGWSVLTPVLVFGGATAVYADDAVEDPGEGTWYMVASFNVSTQKPSLTSISFMSVETFEALMEMPDAAMIGGSDTPLYVLLYRIVGVADGSTVTYTVTRDIIHGTYTMAGRV